MIKARVRMGLMFGALALVASSAIGCKTSAGAFPGLYADRPVTAALPSDLPENPQPCVKYCRGKTEAVYRMVPKLVQVDCAQTREIEETVYEMRAHEVLVKPATNRNYERCGSSCDEELVQVKPGGFRWVHDQDCNCWQYCDQPPEYKWCEKKVEENGIQYCVEDPAKYKTVVKTVPVKRKRTEWVPPRYEVKYVRELYQPATDIWVSKCGPDCAPPDRRQWSKPMPGGALDCGCPSVN